jgi:hypothetical protein
MLEMMKRSKLPPIARWGIEPLPDEPAHGFFLRLAALNGQESIRPFAMALGINGRNIKPQEMMQFCEELPIPGLERMREVTPILNGHVVTIGGEHLRIRRDWSLTNRRYCAACLRESSHHRYWFDLEIMRTCPKHGIELKSEAKGMIWAWGKGPDSVRSGGIQDCPAPQAPTAFSRYLIGRISEARRASLPHLDNLLLFEAIELVIVLGRIIIHQWADRLPESAKNLPSKQEAAETGYNYLAGGGNLKDLCNKYVKSSVHFGKDGFTTKDVSNNLGWLYYYVYGRRSNSIRALRDILESLMLEGNGCRKIKRRISPTVHDQKIEELHALTGIGKHELQALTACNEHLEPVDGSHKFQIPSADEVVRRSNLLIGGDDVMILLGVSRKNIQSLRQEKILVPIVPAAGGKPAKYKRAEVRRLLELARPHPLWKSSRSLTIDQYLRKAQCSFASVISALLDGRIKCEAVDPVKTGLEAILISSENLPRHSQERDFRPRRKQCDDTSINIFQAATLLKTTGGAVRRLIEIGALERADQESGGRIDRLSLARFRSEYATPNLYSVALGCQPQWAQRSLLKLGVDVPSELKECGLHFVDRRETERALSLKLGEIPSIRNTGTVFSALEEYLAVLPQAHRLLWHPSRSAASLVDAKRSFRVLVIPKEKNLMIALPIGDDAVGQRNRSRTAVLSQSWSAAIEKDIQPVGPCLVECYSLDPNMPTEAMAWVAERVATIHAALASSRHQRTTAAGHSTGYA